MYKFNLNSVYSSGKLGLGDICFAIYLLENYGRQQGKTVGISGSKFVNQVYNLFHLNHVQYVEDVGTIKTESIFQFSNKIKPKCCWPWITAFYHYVITKLKLDIDNLELLRAKYIRKPGSEVAVQMDGRTAIRLKIELKSSEIKHFISKFTDEFYIIGGTETKKYLDSKYCLGDLNYLIQNILNCKFFIGSDSGMSHLAGVLGIKSEVVVLQPCFELIKKCYDLYPYTNVYSRSIFQIKII